MSSSPIMVSENLLHQDNCRIMSQYQNSIRILSQYQKIIFRQTEVKRQAVCAIHGRTSQEEHQEILDHLKCVSKVTFSKLKNTAVFFHFQNQLSFAKTTDHHQLIEYRASEVNV